MPLPREVSSWEAGPPLAAREGRDTAVSEKPQPPRVVGRYPRQPRGAKWSSGLQTCVGIGEGGVCSFFFFVLADAQKPNGQSPEQPAVADPTLSSGGWVR